MSRTAQLPFATAVENDSLEPFVWRVEPDQYHAPEHRHLLSSSSLGHLLRGPATYRAWLEGRLREPRSEAIALGSEFDRLLLAPGPIEERVAVIPQDLLDRRGAATTRRAKEFRAQQEALGRRVLRASDDLARMLESILGDGGHAKFCSYLEAPGPVQLALRWAVELPGGQAAPAKALLDKLVLDEAGQPLLIADLKTTRDPNPEEFDRSIGNYGYARQAVWYQDAVEAVFGTRAPFVWLVVGTQPPYECGVYEPGPDYLRIGRWEIERALGRYAAARQSGRWREETHGEVVTIHPPEWRVRKLDQWSV